MGNRTYFVGKMRARDICQQVGIAAELEDWKQLTIEELYQRDLNRRRVEREIAPYLVNTDDRFFGSIIVLVNDPDSIEFETISDFEAKLPKSYELASRDLGFLTVGTGNRAASSGALVALDGQHRLAALRMTVQGAAIRGAYDKDVGDDEVTAIFVLNNSEIESRRLFTTLNRSARKVSRHDLLLMSEDDGRSVIARRLVSRPLLAPRGLEDDPLVKWTGNSIATNDRALTTLNALSDGVGVVAEAMEAPFALRKDYSLRPSDAELMMVEAETEQWLNAIFDAFPELMSLRDNPNNVISERASDRPVSMVLKPAGFVVLFQAIAAMTNPRQGGMQDLAEAVNALSQLNWALNAPHWKGLLMTPKGTISGRRSEWNLAADVIAAIASGDKANNHFADEVTVRYQAQLDDALANLPSVLEAGR